LVRLLLDELTVGPFITSLVPTNEGRSSAISRKGDTLRWTVYSNECLRVIETQNEVASDILLVQQVKLRLISERVTDAPWSSAMIQADDSTNPPAMFYLRSLETQLHAFKSSIPGELADNSKSNLSH
jgi:hypothetical protein